MNTLTQAEQAALIMVASTLIENAPEAAEVAASPFIDSSEFAAFKERVARLRVENCLPAMRKGFTDGFASLDKPC